MRRGVACSVLALLTPALADTLQLRNGIGVKGLWIDMDADQITFSVDSRIQHYVRADVAGITFDRAALEAAPSAQPTETVPDSVMKIASTVPEETRVKEPDIIGAVYYRDPSGALVPLERIGPIERRTSPGFGKISIGAPASVGRYWEMEGPRSPVRLASRPYMRFVVRLANGIDPATFSLYPLETVKNTRRIKLVPTDKTHPVTILTTVTKVGDSSYGLSAGGSFPPGEYAFSPTGLKDAYCFGVDAPASVASSH